jgi:NAD(P)-dependent dehydrogenase (short-subunit alcohol dehydrogenase family)
MKRLQDKVGIVTGGSAGIGWASALALAGEGAAVAVADIDQDRGAAVADEINDKDGRALFVRTDVSNDDDVAGLVGATLDAFGRLDFAFNNAGIEGTPAPTHECTDENWERTLGINLNGVFYCMRHEVPPMLEGGGGAIVNCSSVAGLVGFPNLPSYVAAKHAVVGLTKNAALDYAEAGIRVNAVCPGVIDTEMVERFTQGQEEAAAQLAASQPVGRMGSAREIADAVVWLVSDESTFVTGQAIAVDGGFVAR